MTGIQIREDTKGEIKVVGIEEVEVKTTAEALACLDRGSWARTTASTRMNSTSSRSHAIFSVFLERKKNVNGTGTFVLTFFF